MVTRKAPDPVATRAAVLLVADWLRDEHAETPPRAAIAEAVRLTARTLAAVAPGASVEVRVPPFVAVQCISGLSHEMSGSRAREIGPWLPLVEL